MKLGDCVLCSRPVEWDKNDIRRHVQAGVDLAGRWVHSTCRTIRNACSLDPPERFVCKRDCCAARNHEATQGALF